MTDVVESLCHDVRQGLYLQTFAWLFVLFLRISKYKAWIKAVTLLSQT